MGNDYVPGAESVCRGRDRSPADEEVRRINAELDRVKTGRALDPVGAQRVSQEAPRPKVGSSAPRP